MTFKMLSELVDVCSVPQLNQDIEDHPIDRSQFMEFTEILAINLPVLLDLLSNQEFILELSSEDDSDNVLMRQRLVMLMCEHAPVIPGHTPPYSVDNPELWINLKRICLSSEIASRSVLVDCLASYKERLLNSKWKRDLGSAHGFVYFCDVYLSSGDNPMDLQTILFILSIASQFIDCIHAEVKLLGLRLYAVILVRCPREMVLDTNVHKVVIKSCLDNCQKLIPDECLLLLWDDVVEAVCLDQAMLEDLNWNELDDCLHLLFQRIKLEGKREMRAKLRSKLQRIIVKCYGPGGEEILKDEDMLSVQQKIIGRQNVKLFRWIVDLKELFIFECLSVSNCADSTEEALRFISQMYLLTMSGLSSNIISSTLEDLAKRITPLLLEIYNLYKQNGRVIQILTQLFRLLLVHLDQIIPDNAHSNHHIAIRRLVQDHFQSPLCPQ